MKAISLMQPWATMTATRIKEIETRRWATTHRGPIAIHASRTKSYSALVTFEKFKQQIIPGGTELNDGFSGMTRGAIVAVANLIDCQPVAKILHQLELAPAGFFYTQRGRRWFINEETKDTGDWSEHRHLWFLSDIIMLDKPIPAKGQLGLWNFTFPGIETSQPRMIEIFEAAQNLSDL